MVYCQFFKELAVFKSYDDVKIVSASSSNLGINKSNIFLPKQLMAYGGKLRYTVAFYALDGFGTSNFEPQILMKGGHTSKLVIYVDIPSPENGVRTDKEVEMKEVSQNIGVKIFPFFELLQKSSIYLRKHLEKCIVK